jgi:hypothetical protein
VGDPVPERPELVVVVGMHRSGTSAMTRALQTLGVELGDRLSGSDAEVNAKGFWEDRDLNALNIELLHSLGIEWHGLRPVLAADVEKLRARGDMLRAVELLRSKLGSGAAFGFKDPRVAKLLPFWTEVFKALGKRTSYVVAVRNPLSVAHSLMKRDGLDMEKCFLLWQEHVVTGFVGTEGARRVIVDYDMLLGSPAAQLKRMARALGLEVDPAELRSYANSFLDGSLRHTRHSVRDLELAPNCPELVKDMYRELRQYLDRPDDAAQAHLQGRVAGWADEYRRVRATLVWADEMCTRVAASDATRAAVESRRAEIAGQLESARRRVQRRARQAVLLAERNAQLEEHAAEMAAALRTANDQLASVQARLGSTALRLRRRERQAELLARARAQVAASLRGANEQLEAVRARLAQREVQVRDLKRAASQNEATIAALTGERDGLLSVVMQQGQDLGEHSRTLHDLQEQQAQARNLLAKQERALSAAVAEGRRLTREVDHISELLAQERADGARLARELSFTSELLALERAELHAARSISDERARELEKLRAEHADSGPADARTRSLWRKWARS